MATPTAPNALQAQVIQDPSDVYVMYGEDEDTLNVAAPYDVNANSAPGQLLFDTDPNPVNDISAQAGAPIVNGAPIVKDPIVSDTVITTETTSDPIATGTAPAASSGNTLTDIATAVKVNKKHVIFWMLVLIIIILLVKK
jgi:hypothetical protein